MKIRKLALLPLLFGHALSVRGQSGALVHRYNFASDGSDSVGQASGVLVGGATVVNGALTLNGTTGYLRFPTNFVLNYNSISIETWVTDNGSGNWARIYDFGNNTGGAGAQGTGTQYMFLSLPAGGTANLRGAYTTSGNGGEQIIQWANGGRPAVGHKTHIVWTTDATTLLGCLYADDVLVASNINVTLTPAALGSTLNNWLGRSQWAGDAYFNGAYDEFRVYNFALSPAQVQNNFQSGPDAPAPLAFITTAPTNVVTAGTNVTFNAFATGTPPIHFQWRTNGANIAGATNSYLVLSNVTTAATASYDVVTSNGFGLSNSPATLLSVTSFVPVLAGSLTHRYSFNDGTANDAVGGANGTLVGNASISGGMLILPNATAAAPATDYLQLPVGIVTNDAAVTVEAWATIAPAQYTWANLFDFGNRDGGGASEYDIHACVHSADNATICGISDSDNANADYQFIDLGGGSSLDASTNILITSVINPPGGYVAIFTNGVFVGANSNITIPMSGVQDVRNLVGADNWPDPGLKGSIDELRIYNFALSALQIQNDFQAGPNSPAPFGTVTVSPSNMVYAGTPVTFSLAATGIPPLYFQWRTNGVVIPGATNATLVLTNATTSAAGSYEVIITNSVGSSISPALVLTVSGLAGPSFSFQPAPASVTNYVNGLSLFTAGVSGSPPIALQWFHQGIAIPGATASTLTLNNLQLTDSGTYTLFASNSSGTNLSLPALLTVVPLPNGAQPNVLTSRYNNARTGANTNEYLLTPANVNFASFGRLFSYAVDGYIYTQPLYVANVAFPGQGTHNVIYVASEHDTVYALDADSNVGTNGGVLWQTNLGLSALSSSGEFGNRYAGTYYPDLIPEVGITGTPTIDLTSGTMYLNVLTRVVGPATNYYHTLHALNITNGMDVVTPQVVSASVPGTGVGSTNGVLVFNARQHLQRPGLTLAGGMLVVAWGGLADTDPYHGWVMGFNPATLQPLPNFVFCTTPNATQASFGANAGEGAVWMNGTGLCVDANTNFYFETGNGSFSQNTNGGDYSDSVIKLSTSNTLAVADYFTPYNQASLAGADLDLASAGTLLLPDSAGSVTHPHLLVAGSKAGTIYLLDRDNMGHFNAVNNNQIVQSVVGQVGGMWSSPVYFNNALYYQATADVMKAFTLTNGVISPAPVSRSTVNFSAYGGTPSVSAAGTNNAIAWTLQSDAFASGGPAVLHAYNATNLAQELYNSSQNPARDNPGGAIKMTTPTVANGKVYVGAQYELSVFGFTAFLTAPGISPAGGPFTNAVTITLSDSTPGTTIYYSLDGSIPTTNSIPYAGPFQLTSTLNVQAIAAKPGTVNSAVTSASFVNTAALGYGTGLLGNYWANTSGTAFTNSSFNAAPTLTRTDAAINFNWSTTGPDPSIGQTNFAVRWQGSLQPQYSENYTLTTIANDGVRLWVNGNLLISAWTTNTVPQTNSAIIALNAQQLYTVRLDYFQNTGAAVAQLLWSSPSTALAVIPQTQLYPYTNPPPTVAIVNPTNGATYHGSASITITADADAPYNPINQVSFFTNGILIGTLSNNPYTMTVTGLGAPSYAVTAVATDGSGLSSTSAPVNITVTAGSGLPYGLNSRPAAAAFFNMPPVFTGALPALLSATGVFSNTANLAPVASFIPYSPNTPLWSDSALKSRFFSVPRNSGPDTPDQQIGFAPTGEWTFPARTVFVKTFSLLTNQTDPTSIRRLETRLLVRDTNAAVYGVTYKWRADNSDADLLTGSLTETIPITNTANGAGYLQNWYYPSPADCLTCHNSAANYVLGLKTRQLNGSLTYSNGVTDSQLRALNAAGFFNPSFDEAQIAGFSQLSSITNTSAALVERVRSYLDANCAQCHRPGGTGITFDARYDTPLQNQNLTNFPAAFPLGVDHAKIIAPRDIWRSVIQIRMSTLDNSVKMPPLAHNMVDSNAVQVLDAWINSLPGIPALAPPVLTPSGGLFTNSVTLTLQGPDPNAALYFTLDGTLPTTNSTLYTGPFGISSSVVVMANAFETAYTNSVAVTGVFTIVPPLNNFFAPTLLANGGFQVQYWAPPGQTYVLQSSTDLVHWISIGTNTPSSTPFTWTDPSPRSGTDRFYRVVPPSP